MGDVCIHPLEWNIWFWAEHQSVWLKVIRWCRNTWNWCYSPHRQSSVLDTPLTNAADACCCIELRGSVSHGEGRGGGLWMDLLSKQVSAFVRPFPVWDGESIMDSHSLSVVPSFVFVFAISSCSRHPEGTQCSCSRTVFHWNSYTLGGCDPCRSPYTPVGNDWGGHNMTTWLKALGVLPSPTEGLRILDSKS